MSLLYNNLMHSKRIVSFGCSVVFGEELPDVPYPITYKSTPSKFSYPAMIAEKFTGGNHISYARPGYSNQATIRKIHHYLNHDHLPGDFVVVGITGIGRIEFFNSKINDYINIQPGVLDIITSGDDNSKNKSFIDLCMAYETIISLETTESLEENFHMRCDLIQMLLDSKNIPSVMVQSLEPNTKSMNKNILNNYSIMELTHTSGYGRGKNNHPNEKTHNQFAEMIIQWIKDCK